MTRRLRFSDQADEDLSNIALHIANETGNRRLAAGFAGRLRARCMRLASLPATLGMARPELGSNLRSTPAEGYVIFFRYLENTVEIVTILHGSRDVTAHFDPD